MKHMLGGLLALGIGALCEKPKPDPFAGANILIKANNTFCGAIESVEIKDGLLVFKNVLLDKNKIGEIFSGGFIVKPAQRIGMDIEVNNNGNVEKYTNVWVEEMFPYEEQRETVLIKQMVCRVENTEEQSEENTNSFLKINYMSDVEYFNLKLMRALNLNFPYSK